jgi:hypothetical protein
LSDVVVGINAQGLRPRAPPVSNGLAANLYPTGTAHSIVVASAWEATPWRAVQQAAWSALKGEAPV